MGAGQDKEPADWPEISKKFERAEISIDRTPMA